MRQQSQALRGFGLALVLAIAACSATYGQDIKTNYMQGTDFSKYHTYKWVLTEGPGRPDEIADAQIRQAIDSQLVAKGFTKVDTEKADLLLDYQVALNLEKQWNASGWGNGPGFEGLGGWGGFGSATGTATSSTIAVGNLVLRIYDPDAKRLVWLGIATQTLDPSRSAEKNQKKIDKAMQKLIKEFPPKQK